MSTRFAILLLLLWRASSPLSLYDDKNRNEETMITIGQGEERRGHMLNDPMRKLIPSVAVPSIVAMLVGAIYNMADTFFVGQINTSASGAVGIVMPIMNLLQAFSFIFAHGAASYISRLLGADDTGRASRAVSTGLLCALGVGAIYGAVGIIFMDPLLTLFGATPTILPYAREYALYIYIAAPMFAGAYVLNNALRAEGSTIKSLVGISAGAVLNMALDPIFIFGFDMGVSGAGLATMIGQTVSFFLLISFYVRKGKHKSALRLSLRLFTADKMMMGEILRIGMPSFFRLALTSVATMLLNAKAGAYGDAAIAAFSIVSRILMLVYHVLVGYGQGYQPISGFNYGAGRIKRVIEALRFMMLTALPFMLVCGGVICLFAEPLVAAFRDDPAVIALGSRVLRIQALTLPLMGVTMIGSMFFQSVGKAKPSFVAASARQGLCFVPLVLVLPYFFGIEGLVWVQAAADVVSFMIVLPLLLGALRTIQREQAAPVLQEPV